MWMVWGRVAFIISFVIPSIPGLFLFFSDLDALRISVAVIGKSRYEFVALAVCFSSSSITDLLVVSSTLGSALGVPNGLYTRMV